MAKLTADERTRRADSVVRVIQEQPGLSAEVIGRRLGDVPARMIRDRILWARAQGHAISIGQDGRGYYYLGRDGIDDVKRAALVKHHRRRSRNYLEAHAVLMRQISGMTSMAVAQMSLIDLLIPRLEGESEDDRPVSIDDLAQLPVGRRAGMLHLVQHFLDALAKDPAAWEAERAVLADKYGPIFLTTGQAKALRQAKRLLAEVDV